MSFTEWCHFTATIFGVQEDKKFSKASVTFMDQDSALAARDELDNAVFLGRRVRVDFQPFAHKKLY